MSKMTKGLKRLLKLADHLETGTLGHRRFDMSLFDSGHTPYKCGTAGCAIGECPIAFPRDWKFNEESTPALRVSGFTDFYAAQEYFDISADESGLLFNIRIVSNSSSLPPNVTRKQVARNIRDFVAAKLNPWSGHVNV